MRRLRAGAAARPPCISVLPLTEVLSEVHTLSRAGSWELRAPETLSFAKLNVPTGILWLLTIQEPRPSAQPICWACVCVCVNEQEILVVLTDTVL